MPIRQLLLYDSQLPKLRAQESLEALRVIQVGSGTIRKSDANNAIRTWQSEIGTSRRRAQPIHPAELASMGIRFVRDG